MIYQNVRELIGKTPMVRLASFAKDAGVEGDINAKVEFFNPGGSVKDRAAYYMILAAERQGELLPGGTIVEPTSGNTGIGLAWIASTLGYKLILTMPDTMSKERQKLCSAYGAAIELTPGTLGMQGAVDRAKAICEEMGAFMPMQFENQNNAMAHVETTAQEILADMRDFDAFIACVGTGGTLMGCAKGLKDGGSSARIVAVEPKESPLLSGGQAGGHGIQGIGANFIPGIVDRRLIDEIITVSTDEAMAAARRAAKLEGLLIGISSGAALAACVKYLQMHKGANIVTLLPDTGERYLSTALFDLP